MFNSSLKIFFIVILTNINISAQWNYCTQSTNPCYGKNLENYTISGSKWDKNVFKYYFVNGTNDIPGDGEKTAFHTAFSTWANVVPLSFSETFIESEADIKIKYVSYSEFCTAFGFETSAYACTWQPGTNCEGIILLNDERNTFSLAYNPDNAKDLVYIALHEIGHMLGLCHSNNSSTIMYSDYNPKRSLHAYDIEGIRSIYPSIKVKNIFEGGTIKVGINKAAEIINNLPYWSEINSGQYVNLEAIEQSSGGFNWVWNDNNYSDSPINKSKWIRYKETGSDDRSNNKVFSFSATINDYNCEYVAGLRKKLNATFQNNFIGVGNGGNITVNGSSYSSPTSQFQVVEGNTITVTAQYQEINGIRYLFNRWDDNSTYYQKTFTINNHEQHTAYFIGKPSTSSRNLNFNSSVVGQPIVLSWSEHPNQNVTQYRIWRKIKNGPAGQIIGTVNRGTTSFIDYEYLYVGNGGDTQLQYDVQPYYSVESTYSDPDWLLIGADEALLQKSLQDEGNEKKDIPLCYKIDNYPNPFNPSTNISYQIPSAGFVTIKVYDILGKEIADLVNENKQAGYYNVSFNAGNLPSGIYIYTIQTNGFVQSKKMLFLQ